MWRKNRQPTSMPWCKGVDPNRNWDQAWATGGSSSNPCSEAYHGPSAFSAPEPKAVADYLLALKAKGQTVASYIDFHAYSQLWMSPFGSTCETLPEDHAVLQKGGDLAVAALRSVNGVRFKAGPVCRIIYQASGGSLDWAYAKGGVKYSYAVELRDTGRHGFILPADQIVPSGEETLAAVIALNEYILEN
jgi:carboxypeptidase A1